LSNYAAISKDDVSDLDYQQDQYIIFSLEVSRTTLGSLQRHTDMRRLTTGIRSEKFVVRRFRRCANVIVYLTHTV
jgi:hypothetical protein